VLLSRAVSAQSGAPDSLGSGIRGTVVSVAGGSPIAGVSVALAEANRTTTTTASGTFQLLGVRPGVYTLTVRRLGFGVSRSRIWIERGQVIDADIELIPQDGQQLAPVIVQADSAVHGSLERVQARMHARAGGTFFLQKTLDSARGTNVIDLLSRRASGVSMIRYPATGALLLASSRGVTSIVNVPRADPLDPRSPRACFCQVYLDGVRLYAPIGKVAPPDLSKYDAAAFAAIEFYPGPATTPQEYSGDGAMCGTLLLWSR
jgi:hypothetical protein